LSTLAKLLLLEDIRLDTDVPDKARLLEEIGRHMERFHALPQAWVIQSLSRREQVGSTGVGEGVAIPHARVRGLDRIQVAYMRLKLPIPYGAPDGKPVSDILVLLVPKEATEEHLKVLADASRMFIDSRFRTRLHACANPIDVRQVFADWKDAA
jgi:nitrogen PTS system EIIA component